jgi:hypothetical protein
MKLVLLSLVLVLQVSQPITPEDFARAKREAKKAECASMHLEPSRIVVPFNYTGQVCYETASQSLVCDR